LPSKVLLYLDYDKESGFGHISRSRTFVEAISSESTEIFMCSALNPLDSDLEIGFLGRVNWIPHTEIETMNFDLIYIDSYNEDILRKAEKFSINKKILVIDANFVEEIPGWPDLVIDLERSSPRKNNFNGNYLFADLMIHSELQSAKARRDFNSGIRNDFSNLAAVVNFGGSVSVNHYLRQLDATFAANNNIFYVVYVPHLLFETLKIHFRNLVNVKVKIFSTRYHYDLENCDFLITNSGTSFMEGLYLGVPMVIFSLFPNAQSNFSKHRFRKRVIHSGFAVELETEWLNKVLEYFEKEFSPGTLIEDNADLTFLDVNTIRTELNSRVLN
jgi:spore coat polysaccharide biosynthesis predicted glycosyltransferase SpsG